MKRTTLWLVFAATISACAASKPVTTPTGPALVGDDWFAWRAETLGVSEADARARDASLPAGVGGPPTGVLDDHTQGQAAALWAAECARCHGIDGNPPEPEPGKKKPIRWAGMTADMGFAMGGDKMRAKLYGSIAEGKGDMPAWGQTLSREQIWALIRHIEDL